MADGNGEIAMAGVGVDQGQGEQPEVGEEKSGLQLPGNDIRFAFHMGDGALIAPPPGQFSTWRNIIRHPTVALARAVTTAPARMANVAVVKDNDDVPDERRDFIQAHKDRLWGKSVKEMLMARDLGFSPFEKVFAEDGGSIILKKLKYLIPEKTTVVLDKDSHQFAGLQQRSMGLDVLPAANSFVYSHDRQGDNWYGLSILENIREDAWHNWKITNKKLADFIAKAAGVLAFLEYPEGRSRDRNGTERENAEIAEDALVKITSRQSMAVPNVFNKFAGDLARSGINMDALKAWRLQFLEAKGNHAQQMLATLNYYDKLMMRGLLAPERSAIEGQFGTKAEAETHGNLLLSIADMLLEEMVEHWNCFIVDQLLWMNFGREAVGSVRLEKEGLDPITRIFFRDLAKTVLANPANIALLLDMVDFSTIMEQSGLPVKDNAANASLPPLQDAEQKEQLAIAMNMIYKREFGTVLCPITERKIVAKGLRIKHLYMH